MNYYLGIDVGGTNLRAAVATENRDIVSRATAPTPGRSDRLDVTEVVLRLVDRACADAGIDPGAVVAAGVGSVGPLDSEAGTVVGPANVGGDGGRIQLVQPLRDRLQTDAISLTNDAICGVIAEREFADAATDDMVYLTISTGIGAGVVVDGDVLFGNGGNAAEVGHVTVDPSGRMECGCGCTGHWEAYCGGENVPDYAAHLRREVGVETDLPVDEADFTAAELFDGVGDDELADLTVERIGRWNTIGVATVIQAFAPTYVAVGGAVALNNPETILEPIRATVSDRVMIDVPEIAISELGADAVLRGALVTARRRATRTP